MIRQKIPRQPFIKYVLNENKQDSITFYLSETQSQKKLPLLVFVQGSGNFSLYQKNNGAIVPQYGHMTWYDVSKDQFRVLVVEKPGVWFLKNGDDNFSFDRAFSLDSWTKRIEKVILQVVNQFAIDTSNIIVVGHSEGGVVAASIANNMGHLISQVVIMAGEGPSQLYSLYKFADTGIFFNRPGFTKKERIDSLMQVWSEIQKSPTSVDKTFWGFTYLRWSSFLKTSVLEQLNNYKGKILIVQGTNDKNVFPESATILYLTLLSKMKDVRLLLVDGGDHSFNIQSKPEIDGWRNTLEEISSRILK